MQEEKSMLGMVYHIILIFSCKNKCIYIKRNTKNNSIFGITKLKYITQNVSKVVNLAN